MIDGSHKIIWHTAPDSVIFGVDVEELSISSVASEEKFH
jgi:hypothetical protein